MALPSHKRWGIALAIYLAMWATIFGGVIYGVVRAGYSTLIAIACACLLHTVLNGSMAYRAHVRQFRTEGKQPYGYSQYFLGLLPQSKQKAPPSAHVFVGIAAALAGAFLLYCGGGLFVGSDWARISEPFIVGAFCIVLVGIGAALLYVAWRLFSTASGRELRMRN